MDRPFRTLTRLAGGRWSRASMLIASTLLPSLALSYDQNAIRARDSGSVTVASARPLDEFAAPSPGKIGPESRPEGGVRRLTFEECLQIAGANNSEILAAEQTIRQNMFLINVPRGALLPQVSATIKATRDNGTAVANDPSTGPSNLDAAVTITQNLFNGFIDVEHMRQSSENLAGAEANLRIIKAKVSFELKSAYQGLLFANAAVDLAREIVQRREHNLKMVQLRYESGAENKGSLLLSRAYLEEAKFNLLVAQDATATAQAQLRKSLGFEGGVTFEIARPIPTVDPTGAFVDLFSIAADTPVHKQAVATEESARHGWKALQGAYYPTLDFKGIAGRQGQDELDTNHWSMELALTIPIFSGGKDFSASEAASANYLSQERFRENIDRQLVAQLQDAYVKYSESIAKFKMDSAFKDALQVRAQVARAKYNQGLLTFDDWDIIENDLIARERNFIQSGRDRVVNEAAWEQAQGKGAIP